LFHIRSKNDYLPEFFVTKKISTGYKLGEKMGQPPSHYGTTRLYHTRQTTFATQTGKAIQVKLPGVD